MIWEDGSGSAEREIARLEAVGELDGVVLHIVHWQTDEAIAAANELMRDGDGRSKNIIVT